jgi:hypothetical protein
MIGAEMLYMPGYRIHVSAMIMLNLEAVDFIEGI